MIQKTENWLKRPAVVALGALFLLFIGGIVLYKERVFFGDASFLVFNVVNYKRPYIQWNRYGSIATQIFPYLAQKLHLPIKAILLSYAASFNFFYLVSALIVFACKQYKLVIVMSLYFVLFFTESYFWVSEVPQAVAWMFVYLAVTLLPINRKYKVPILLPIILVLAFLAISTHFAAVIPLTYLWVYFILDKEKWSFSRNATILLSIVPVAVTLLRFLIVGSESGENTQLHAVTHFSIKDILLIVTTPIVKMFAIRCFTLYLPAVIFLALSIFSLKRTGKKSLLIWTVISCLGYFIIMGLTFGGHDAGFPVFHIESEWSPIAILFTVPFVFSYLPAMTTRSAIMLLAITFIIRIGYICLSIPKFQWRNEFKERVLMQMKKKGITKLALYNEPEIQSKLMLDWSLPDESILMSAQNGDNPQLTFRFVARNDTATFRELAKPKYTSISFDYILPENLNSEYYNIDTTTSYTITSYEDLFK
jgi:hypothetical protein